MKTVTQMIKQQWKVLGSLLLVATVFSSCLKDRHDDIVVPPAALISVINASPNSQPIDFYLDQNRANNFPVKYGDGFDYVRAYTGKRTATFYVAGTQQKIKSDTMTLKADQFYSLFLANSANTPDFILLRDSISEPASGMAAIRVVNASAGAPAVDLAIKQGNVLATNKAYKIASPFVAVQNNTYTLEIRQAGTSTVLATLADVKIKAKSVYTVWLQGIPGAADDTKLTAHLQLNAYYY